MTLSFSFRFVRGGRLPSQGQTWSGQAISASSGNPEDTAGLLVALFQLGRRPLAVKAFPVAPHIEWWTEMIAQRHGTISL